CAPWPSSGRRGPGQRVNGSIWFAARRRPFERVDSPLLNDLRAPVDRRGPTGQEIVPANMPKWPPKPPLKAPLMYAYSNPPGEHALFQGWSSSHYQRDRVAQQTDLVTRPAALERFVRRPE